MHRRLALTVLAVTKVPGRPGAFFYLLPKVPDIHILVCMLVLRGHNQLGNVLHVITGPESELQADIHGANILDITPVLAVMNADEKCYLSITRTKSENLSSSMMRSAGIQYLSSFGSAPKAEVPEKTEQDTDVKVISTCEYCGGTRPLLALDQFRICAECAIIELGRGKEAKK